MAVTINSVLRTVVAIAEELLIIPSNVATLDKAKSVEFEESKLKRKSRA